MSVVFPNYELFISISLLINVISPLFNHVAYRHTVNKSAENAIREKNKVKVEKEPECRWNSKIALSFKSEAANCFVRYYRTKSASACVLQVK